MDKPRPYVTAALLCEKVLVEKDETITLVRVADRIQYSVQGVGVGLPAGLKPIIKLHGLVAIKSGLVTGDHLIDIFIQRPSGDRKEVVTYPVKFLGQDHGQNLILNMGIGIDQDGLYWFDVLFDGELLTRIPLMVTPAQEQTPPEQKT
ncbi:MAG: hypothetical protein LAO24_09515 [Acidobacteriia bacterium]|nr:hypothetical protein [Terriglobia bacterium]